jgi:hypothetical protein
MMTARNGWRVLLTALLITHFSLLISCSSIDCPVQNTVFTVYNFMKADGTPDTLMVDTLWIITTRADSTKKDTLLNSLYGDKAMEMKLQISQQRPVDEFYFLLKDSVKTHPYLLDTVRIQKEDFPHFEAADCQAAFFHRITAVSTTHNFIDSIIVKNPDVNYDASKAHFYLYLKARY